MVRMTKKLFDLKRPGARITVGTLLLLGSLAHLAWPLDTVRELASMGLGPLTLQLGLGLLGTIWGIATILGMKK